MALRDVVQAKMTAIANAKNLCDKALTMGNLWLNASDVPPKTRPRFDDVVESEYDASAQDINSLLTKANAFIDQAKTELAKV